MGKRPPLYEIQPKGPVADPNAPCVYRIWFKDKYYVGRTINLGKRMKEHQNEINKKMLWPDYAHPKDYHQKILDHIGQHDIFYGYYEVLECAPADSEFELYFLEQKWLDLSKNDPNCLNYGFIAALPAVRDRYPPARRAGADLDQDFDDEFPPLWQ